MKISKDKQYKTRSGLAVVILADNVPGSPYPVVGYTVNEHGKAYHYQWTDAGKFYQYEEDTDDLDLFPAPVITVEFGAIWDHDHAQGMTGWSTDKQQYHNYIGLTWNDGTTLNGKAWQFYSLHDDDPANL